VKFNLVDKVEQISDQKIVTVKYVSLAEEYLADHFPTFPVLPGVMMLEAAVQSGTWLLHQRTNFSHSICVLREARNVKYGTFVAPGNFLRMEVELLKTIDTGGSFKGSGSVGDKQAVQLRFELALFSLGQKKPELAEIDDRLREHNRRRWDLIRPTPAPAPLGASVG
jgi:3-hydroxyacyl-[acyl-carrier-protein] dehydratase